MKIHTNERIFSGNEEFLTLSVRHLVILPKLQEIRKKLNEWCRIAHGKILLQYLFFCYARSVGTPLGNCT